MVVVKLPARIEKRLEILAKRTGRTKSFYAREAIVRHLDDLEDYELAQRRLLHGYTRAGLGEVETDV
jgi:RHH-type rel operon transcriptional repressor/antitoxin RelB